MNKKYSTPLSDPNAYFIIQARVGSKRLPNKMLMPFHNGKLIIEIIIDRLINIGVAKSKIIIATTDNPLDNQLIERLEKNEYQVFIGNESNVLNRFIEVGKHYNVEKLFRICADNPFLNTNFILQMLDLSKKNLYDYISYSTSDDIPTIKTHYGIFCEYVSFKALEKVAKLTQDYIYLEHVTNYIYTHQAIFNCSFLQIPLFLDKSRWLRLTVDTIDDFKTAQNIFAAVKDPMDIGEIIKFSEIYGHKICMIEQINQNAK